MKVRAGILLAASVALVAACSGGSSYNSTTGPSTGGDPLPTPPANTVIASATLVFNPTTLNVATGTNVTFTFEGVTHNVTFTTASGAPADIPNSSNTSVTRVFASAGSYGYRCTIHPQMTGTVVVQ